MTSRKMFVATMTWFLAVLTASPGICAQAPQSSKAPTPESPGSQSVQAAIMQDKSPSGESIGEIKLKVALAVAAANGGQSFEFTPSEFEYRFGDTPVKGAPFSAQIVIENTQTLASGVHISHRMTGALYRDAEGRTRREQPRDGATEIVTINDPVGAVSYRLNLFQRTAQKLPAPEIQADADMKKKLAARKAQAEEAAQKGVAETSGTPESTVIVTTQGYENKLLLHPKSELPQKKELLGKQMVEGVEAEGTRSTITIPAGKEGNDQPFDIVSESWYSADLQMTVMSKHSDPRTGDNVYRLTNINRSEPESSLFSPPPDFSVVDLKTERRRRE